MDRERANHLREPKIGDRIGRWTIRHLSTKLPGEVYPTPEEMIGFVLYSDTNEMMCITMPRKGATLFTLQEKVEEEILKRQTLYKKEFNI